MNRIRPIAITVATLLVASLAIQSNAQETGKYNGRWWLSISKKKRTSFLNGYLDCYAFEASGSDRFGAISRHAQQITALYETNPQTLEVSVADVFHKFKLKDDDPEPMSGGESWNEPHWYYDGEFWREIGSLGRTAFVEGYMYCLERAALGSRRAFPRSAQYYSNLVTTWYPIDDEKETINIEEMREKIARVLFQFACPSSCKKGKLTTQIWQHCVPVEVSLSTGLKARY